MSGILGILTLGGASPSDVDAQRMLGAMPARGRDYAAVWQRDPALLAVTRHDWERAPHLSGDALVVWDGELAVAADASLYYRDDLGAKLESEDVPAGATASHLILAAYRAWGDDCVEHLEGDYAFIVWDRKARRVFCARDFAGSRPLFFAEVGHSLVIASSLAALRAYSGSPSQLNSVLLAETAANLWIAPEDTAYTGVTALPAGFSLTWSGPGQSYLRRHWNPRFDGGRAAMPFAEAAREVRDLLRQAVEERLDPGAASAVWMSGGRDSTAVFATGQDVAQMRGLPALRAVSVSFPPGDCGREDEVIAEVGAHWRAPVDWLDIRDIPLFDLPQAAAARRDEPYEPAYAQFNRALARRSRAIGARVILDGWGGDQLFGQTPLFLADLFRRGRWLALARHWRALGVDFRYLFRTAVTPALPPILRRAAALLRRGRPLTDDYEIRIPAWIRGDWNALLAERQQPNKPRWNSDIGEHEFQFLLMSGSVARVRGWLSTLGLEEGVEMRSPLYDRRLIELAVTRPVTERRAGRDTKVLLRAALRGLLPDAVLAPRQNRTGVTDHYLRSSMQVLYPPLLDEVLASTVALADLGIVDPAMWRRSAETCLTHAWDIDVAMALIFTLQTELWIRAHRERHLAVPDDGQSLAVLQPGNFPVSQ